jgi:hypothetical protein
VTVEIEISDRLYTELTREAGRRGVTVDALAELVLRQFLGADVVIHALPPLPSLDMGGELVDIADRDALYDAMERQ